MTEEFPKKKLVAYLGSALVALLGIFLLFQWTTPDLTDNPGNLLGLSKTEDSLKARETYSAAPILDQEASDEDFELKQVDQESVSEAGLPPETSPTIDQISQKSLDQLEAEYENKFGSP